MQFLDHTMFCIMLDSLFPELLEQTDSAFVSMVLDYTLIWNRIITIIIVTFELVVSSMSIKNHGCK